MTKKKTKRRLKLEELHQQLFLNMTDFEIENFIPKIPVTLFKRASDGNIGSCITSCPICGKKHMHHWRVETNEYRAAHCETVKDLVYPMQYELILDWNYANNAEFKEQYFQQVKEYESDPVAFNKSATRRQVIYHKKLEDRRIQKLMHGNW